MYREPDRLLLLWAPLIERASVYYPGQRPVSTLFEEFFSTNDFKIFVAVGLILNPSRSQ